MSRDIDLTVSNYTSTNKILRPSKNLNSKSTKKPQSKQSVANSSSQKSSFTIEKSFTPDHTSKIPEAHKKILQPHIDSLKEFVNTKAKHEQYISKLIAQDIIKPEELIKTVKKEEGIADQGIKVGIDGKMRDQKDNLVFAKSQSLQLLANKNKERDQKEKQMQLRQRKRLFERVQHRSLKDTNLILSTNKKRVKRTIAGLQFIEQGSLQRAKKLYSHATRPVPQEESLSELIKKQEQQDKQKIEEPELIKFMPIKKTRVSLQFSEMLPDKEWWDELLLKCSSYEFLWPISKASEIPGDFLNLQSISSDIQKGRLFKEQQQEQIVMPVFLTKDEKKKLKRRRKQQRLKQRNDKIKLGQLEPQKPKIKFSNMAIVLKDEFVMDPSRVEAEVRKQVQNRLDKHQEHNASRKLTKQKKAQKTLRKLKRDSAKETRIAVFRIESVKDRTARFKSKSFFNVVEMNVKQLALNGYFFVPTDHFNGPAVVVVEGGRRAIKFFKNLMLNRINWTQTYRSNLLTKEEAEVETIDHQEKVILEGNRCRLVWEAVITETTFTRWKSEFISCESDAIRLLAERKVQHLWDSVMNYKEEV